MLPNIRNNCVLTLRYPHEINKKTDQKQQLNKIRLYTAVKARLCE